jgi:hypothetical protein
VDNLIREVIKMEIKDRVLYSEKFEWRKLKPFQPENLKEMEKESFIKLKNSLKTNDFIASFDVWKQNEENYWILDGHHRKYALDDLVNEGCIVPEKFQCNFIHCENEQDACYAIVAKASSHAKMNELGFTEWATKYGLDFGRMIETTDIPNFDLEAVWNHNKVEIDIIPPKEQENKKNSTCPNCGLEF